MTDPLPTDPRKRAWDPECVLGVAIKHALTDVVHFMSPPARHHDIIKALVDSGVPAPIGHERGYVQGFMTVLGFRDRLVTGKMIGHQGLLTSEDLW